MISASNSAQNNGTALIIGTNVVNNADNTKCVVLPTAVAGAKCVVKCVTSGKTLPVFPAVNGIINEGSANASYVMANLAYREFSAADNTTWYTDEVTPT